jgi:uncharacterized protein (DUF58 family)
LNPKWRSYPAPKLVWLMLIAIPLAVLGIFANFVNLLLALWILVLFVVALADRMLFPPCSIRSSRPLPPRLVIGKTFEMQIVFRNEGRSKSVFFGVDQIPSKLEGECVLSAFELEAGEACTFPIPMRALRRGRFQLGPMHITQEPGLRLWRHHAVLDNGGEIKVYPDYQPGAKSLDHLQQVGELGIRRTRQRGEGTDFESLREYRDGDDSARIDWKATSRLGRAVSRQYTIEKDHDVVIALDCGRLMGAQFNGVSKFDHTIRAALALAETSIRAGDRVGLMVFDSSVRCFIPPSKGPTQLGRILDALHDLDSILDETEFQRSLTYLAVHHRKRSLVVLFTDFIDQHTAAPMLLGLANIARRHACLFVAVEDPTFDECLASLPLDVEGLASQAVAYGMRKDRQQVLEILRREGIDVLNQLPDNLTAPVINSYLRLKDSGRL